MKKTIFACIISIFLFITSNAYSIGDEMNLTLLSPEACYIDGVRQTANSPCN